jgi:hypothetical protein
MRVVTTYDPKTWDLFARDNIKSFVEHIDAEVVVYHEIERTIEGTDERNLFQVPGLQKFLEMIQHFLPARGRFIERGKPSYNYNYDAWKFCRKVFAIADAAEDMDYLIWLDADVEVFKPITKELIKTLIGDDAIALFQREQMHPECGVIIFNMRHPLVKQGIDRWVALYREGHVFKIPMGWHDCWTLQAMIDGMELDVSNLSPQLTDSIDVINNSMLSAYLRHDKGNRKYARAGNA